jgi:organic radical activating enzyme
MDYPDGESWAIEIYMCGCDFFCKECCNPALKNYNYQENTHVYYVPNLVSKVKEVCRVNSTNKIVILGGDPLSKVNRNFTKEFLIEMGMDYDICLYTGYTKVTVEELKIQGFTFVKCGTFCENLRQVSCKTEDYIQFASSNQALYDSNLNELSVNGKYYFKGANR